jgi:16S rRNA (uracil1498-N3)-methyltransferase
MHQFHCTSLLDDRVFLPEEEAHHATSVLRLAAGQRIVLLDGHGTRAVGEILEVGKRGCSVHILQRSQHAPERNARIHLAVGPTKQMDRFEWFVEKAVEIGIDRITPLLTERTERDRIRIDRLERVAVSAMKQSQRAWLPKIDALTPLKSLLAAELPEQRYFGRCEGERSSLVSSYRPEDDVLMVIGPEGDLSPREAEDLVHRGFKSVTLGEARLRTETAALAVCTWFSLAQQR